MRSIYKKKVLNKKFSTNENKVKGLGSPLRAEPSGRPCRSGKLRLPTKSVCKRLK